MLVCYLDDSGKDKQNRVTTIAGYLASDTAWSAFEKEVEPIFKEQGVSILHASEMETTKGEFKNWRVLRKQAFVSRLCSTLAKHMMLGVSMSVVKDTYKKRAIESSRKQTVSPYTFCFNVIIDWILRDIRTGRAVWAEGLSLVLESGHDNCREAENHFHEISALHNLGDVLRSIRFVPKTECRAIQLADLFAFYTRRDSGNMEFAYSNNKTHKTEQMLKIITERGQFRGFVATDFDQPPI